MRRGWRTVYRGKDRKRRIARTHVAGMRVGKGREGERRWWKKVGYV